MGVTEGQGSEEKSGLYKGRGENLVELVAPDDRMP